MQDIMSRFMCGSDSHLLGRKLAAMNTTRINGDHSILACGTVWIEASVQDAASAGDFFLFKIAILRGKAARPSENSVHWHRQFDGSPLHCSAILVQDAFGVLFYRIM